MGAFFALLVPDCGKARRVARLRDLVLLLSMVYR